MKKVRPDCLVIGHWEEDYRTEISACADFTDRGDYDVITRNSIRYAGKRYSYLEMLNLALQRTRTRHTLHLDHWELPNVAVCSLVSHLSRHGYHAQSCNYADKISLDSALACSPKTAIVSTTFQVTANPLKSIIAEIRSQSPETAIILGGPYIYRLCLLSEAEERRAHLAELGADFYILASFGEQALIALLHKLLRNAPSAVSLSAIPNVAVRNRHGLVVENQLMQEVAPLEEMWVDWTKFSPLLTKTGTAMVRTARSCTYRCSFCNFPYLAGQHQSSSIKMVEKELTQLASLGVKRILFTDDTFNIPEARFKELCRMMIANAFNFSWYSFFRAGNCDRQSIELAASSGCKGVFLGIESGDDLILKLMNKNTTAQRYSEGMKLLHDQGIFTFANVIVGFPGETEESALRTLKLLQDTKPTFYYLELYFHRQGIPINDRANEFGLSGLHYQWIHNTMSWKTASDLIERMLYELPDSIYSPLKAINFWGLPYLIGKGLPLTMVKNALQLLNEMMRAGLKDSAYDEEGCLARLTQTLESPSG